MPEKPFPWAIVGAAATAAVVVVAVAVLIATRSGHDDGTRLATATPSSSLATTTTSLATTTTEAPTTVPLPATTAIPTTVATTLPPKPVGFACPSGPTTNGTVVIRDEGKLNFRTEPAADARKVDSASNGEPVRFWTDPGTTVFQPDTFKTWVTAQLPGNPASCGFASASNIHMAWDTFGTSDRVTECTVFETATAAVNICSNDGGDPDFEVEWKAERSADQVVGTATYDDSSGSWKAQAPGSDLLYTVSLDKFSISRNFQDVFTDDVLDTEAPGE